MIKLKSIVKEFKFILKGVIMKTIVCYGDSNTYGYKPYHKRYNKAYPEILESILGEKYRVYNEGLNGRTSIYNDPDSNRIGINNVEETLIKYHHIDYLVFMLGTNDLKVGNAKNIDDMYKGLDMILTRISKLGIVDHFVFVSPIKVGEALDKNASELSLHFYEVYEKLAKKYKPDYLIDAKELISPSFDNCHFKEEDHYVLAEELAKYFKINNID